MFKSILFLLLLILSISNIYLSVCICPLLYFDLIKSVSSRARRTSQVSLSSHRSFVSTYIHTCTSHTDTYRHIHVKEYKSVLWLKNEHSYYWPRSICSCAHVSHSQRRIPHAHSTGVIIYSNQKYIWKKELAMWKIMRLNVYICIYIYILWLRSIVDIS